MLGEQPGLEDVLYGVVYRAVRAALADHATTQQAAPEVPRRGRGGDMQRLTVDEAAAIAHRRPETIRLALQAGQLVGHQRVKGGRWLIKPEALEAWIAAAER